MADRTNHYELAFEEYLRARQVPYVAVDETRRSLLAGGSIKSLDFIVSPPGPQTWLVDVKGRRFPSGDEQKHYWKNWSTLDDLRSLAQWERLFGPSFCGLFVFAYNVLGDRSPLPTERLFRHHGEFYAFIAVRLTDYSYHARPISAAWETVAMPTGEFRRVAQPVADLFEMPASVPVCASIS
ncbi:MAG TPA: HYExAFE family protein [Pirellulales bacterium]|nr:HYExAFE family protein [Pirellulales bacterium]